MAAAKRTSGKSAKRSRKAPSKPKRFGAIAGVAAIGLGAGLAVERVLVGRARNRSLEDDVKYGKVKADRLYEVSSFDGAELVVHEFGPPDAKRGVVFLHGFCLDHRIWHYQMKEWGPDSKTVVYDARDHGASRGGEGPFEVSTLARDLEAVLDSAGLEQSILVGHSMGGMTVLEFCRTYEHLVGTRVAGIVLVNTTYTDALKTIAAAGFIGPLERGAGRLIYKLLNDPRASRAIRTRGDDLSYGLVRLFGFGPDASAAQVEFVCKLLAQFPSPPLIEWMKGIRKFDMGDALSAIDVPTLVMAGGDDRITTVRASKKIAQEINGARLIVFDNAGHTSMMERHEDFDKELQRFIAGVFDDHPAAAEV